MTTKKLREKTAGLRQKSAAEVREELLALRREQFNLRMSAAAGQPARPDQHGKVRKNIARVKTVLNELERAQRAGGKA